MLLSEFLNEEEFLDELRACCEGFCFGVLFSTQLLLKHEDSFIAVLRSQVDIVMAFVEADRKGKPIDLNNPKDRRRLAKLALAR
jgi:hypothetical protein